MSLIDKVDLWLAVLSDIVALIIVILNGLRVINFYGNIINQSKIYEQENQKLVNQKLEKSYFHIENYV